MDCVDASVVAKWFFDEEHSTQAEALLSTVLDHRERLLAPPLLSIELVNIFYQRTRSGTLTITQAADFLHQYASYPITVLAPPSLAGAALRIADSYSLPAAYDAHYIALAQFVGGVLWTDDRRLLRSLSGRLPSVRAIAAFGE